MISFATLNIQKAGDAKVNALADLMFDEAFPCDVLCVQELDLNELSASTFLAMLRGRGLHVFHPFGRQKKCTDALSWPSLLAPLSVSAVVVWRLRRFSSCAMGG